MKKNISINISGIIFHIEEDGYDQLKNYLDSIIKYFSGYEDSQEIIADIENRIAEIFTGKLNKGKEVITAEDVTFLIATMGTVSDFKATEEKEYTYESATEQQTSYTTSTSKPKKVYRDLQRKILGGVAAGLANYLKIDPIWIRLIFIAFFFGISFIHSLSGFTFICYIILWIALPGSETLESEEHVKKLYRNPDDRVIAGVCSGLAAYFGIDLSLVRILFVIGIFLGGSTIIIYLILAAIAPVAKTTTEKMKMQGEPVTLSNIESNIKKNFNLKGDKDENTFTKILLFPFRIIAMVFTSLGSVFSSVLLSIGEIVRVILGIFLTCIPLIGLTILVIALGIILGVTNKSIAIDFLPIELIIAEIPIFSVWSLFTAIAIPLIFICFAGIGILAKRNVINPAIHWILTALFVAAAIFTATTIPGIVKDYKRKASFVEEQIFPVNAKTIILKGNLNQDIVYNQVTLNIKSYPGQDVKLVKEFSSRGKSKQEALQNSKMIEYSVAQTDSTLTFDQNFTFKKGAIFRGQRLNLTLYVPFGKEFLIKENMEEILESKKFCKNERWKKWKDEEEEEENDDNEDDENLN